MAKKKARKRRRQETPGVDERFDKIVTLENIEEARTIFPRSEISDLIAQAGEKIRENLIDEDGFYDSDKVTSYYLRKRNKDINAFLKQEDDNAHGLMGRTGVRNRRKRIKEALTRNLGTLVNGHVQDLNVELSREKLKVYSKKDGDYNTLIDALENPDKYQLSTAKGRKSLRKSLESEEYQKLFDKLVPLFKRPAAHKKAKKGTRKAAPRKVIPGYLERMKAMGENQSDYLKVESPDGIQELRGEFKGERQLFEFDNLVLPYLRDLAATYRYNEARKTFGDDYALRQQALAKLDEAIALGSEEAALVKDTYLVARKIIEEGDGRRAENLKAVSLLESIQPKVDVSRERSLFGSLEYAKLLACKAGKAKDPAERTGLYEDAKRVLSDALKIEPAFKGAQSYLDRYAREAK